MEPVSGLRNTLVGVTVIITMIGAVLVLVALRDVFDTLFHPHGQGVVSERLIQAVWRIARSLARGNHQNLSLAGPVAFVTVISAWGAMVVLGFGLIIWPQLTDGFAFSAGLNAADQGGFVDAVYLSLVNVTSLGYGDIVATTDVLRLLGPLETVIGLGLLTASISWIMLLYGVLSASRSLSHQIALLTEVEFSRPIGLAGIEPSFSAGVLADLTSGVVKMRDDLVHSPIAYYFHPRDPRHALPVLLPGLLKIVDSCSATDPATALAYQAAMLDRAIDELLATVAEEFLGCSGRNPRDALEGYRRDHLWAD